MQKKLIIGVLASGSGSNLQAIIDRIEEGALDASIGIVISNRPDAFALERAARHGVRTALLDHRGYGTRKEFEQALIETFHAAAVELVVMAGFMRVLSEHFLSAFPLKVMNIHPALLPSFPGLDAQQQAFDYGVKFSGCSVHFADDGVDTGPIIMQAVVPVLPGDTPETLRQRILAEEHRLYPQAIQFFAQGRIRISGRIVTIADQAATPIPALHNPHLEDR